MGTLTQCIRSAGKALDASDAAAVRALRDELKAEGLEEQAAAREAVLAQIAELVRQRNELLEGSGVSPDQMPSPEIAEKAADYEGDGYSVRRDKKTGAVSVTGDIAAARAMLPDGLSGRATKDGLKFTGSAAARAYNSLTGRTSGYSRAGEVTKHPIKDGKYVGAPPKFNTPAKITSLRRWLKGLAMEGEPGRMWYENSSKAVLDFVGGDAQEAKKFVALLAIYSAQSTVSANTTAAIRAWAQHKAGQPIQVINRVKDKKATAALSDVESFWSGEKTGNFFNNLLIEIDEDVRQSQGATIDLWMMRAGQYPNDAPNRSQYAFMEVETNRLAQDLGWEPHQVQAAIWVALKARMENKGVKQRVNARSEKNGWIRFDRDSKGRKILVKLDAEKHRNNWLNEALKLEVSQKDTDVAKFDYADALRRHIGTSSVEGGAQDVIEALTDDGGSDLLAMKVGLLSDSGDLVIAPDKGASGKKSADPYQVESLNIYADTLRQLSGSDRAHWWRPFYSALKADKNAVMINLDRMATDEEMDLIEAAVDGYLGDMEWRSRFAIVKDRDGAVMINYGAVENEDLKKIASALPDMGAEFEQFAADGQILGDSNEEQVAGLGSERQSNILAWARGIVEGPSTEAQSEEGPQGEIADVYDAIETRPETSAQQQTAGRSAIRDLLRRLDAIAEAWSGRGVDGEQSTLLGSRLAAGFRAGEPQQLIGKKADTGADVAALAQVYRDPRFETLRAVFVKGGKVVGESAVTSRMPGAVSFKHFKAYSDHIQKHMDKLGADGYYMLHNHPSGVSTPSASDRKFTQNVTSAVPGFVDHVIIDFNEFSTLNADGSSGVERKQADFGAVDFYGNPEVDNEVLGDTITGPDQAGRVARTVADPNRPVVVIVNSQGNVQIVTSLAPKTLELLHSKGPAATRAKATLRAILREGGAGGRMFLVMPENSDRESQIDVAASDGIDLFADAFTADGRSIPFAQSGNDVNQRLNRIAPIVEERLEGLPDTVVVDGREVAFEDFPPAKEAARKYMKSAGLEYNEPTEYAPLDQRRARKIAREFEEMQHAPNDPAVKAAYQAMIDETLAQYQAVLDTGLTVRFITGADPYGNPRNAILDVVENNNMFVFSTRDGFGSDENFDASENPLLQETEFKTADGDPMLANDVFRVVHDYFGHIKNGVGFRARGEENAWQSHAAMYSPLARRAMTTETRGQNSWVNFGPNAEQNRTASGADTVYADQKIGLLPIWVSEEGRLSERDRQNDRRYTEGLEGAVDEGRVQLTHFSRREFDRTNPGLAGTGLDRKVSGRRRIPQVTYFGITQANENRYRREAGLGRVETQFSLPAESLYPADADPDGLWDSGDYRKMQDAGFSGFWSDNPALGKVAVVWDPLQSEDSVAEESAGYDIARDDIDRSGLYSNMARVIQDARIPGLKPSKRNPAGAIRASSWLQYLRNRGIKQEEWLWTGMREMLNSDPRRRFTRDEMLQEARARATELGDVVAGENAEAYGPQFESMHSLMRENPTEYWMPGEQQITKSMIGVIASPLIGRPTHSQSREQINDDLRGYAGDGSDVGFEVWRPEGSEYAIIGNANTDLYAIAKVEPDGGYSLVSDRGIISFNEAKVHLRSNLIWAETARSGGANPMEAQWEEYIDDGDFSNYREIKVTLPNMPGEPFMKRDHFPDRNLIGFLRVTDRDNGDRMYVEELQSDWHQQGRQYGYRPEMSEDEAEALEEQAKQRLVAARAALEVGLKDIIEVEFRPDVKSIARTLAHKASKKAHERAGILPPRRAPEFNTYLAQSYRDQLPSGLMEELDAAADEVAQMRKALSFQVPDAPFKNDAWISLLAKRALVDAARGDYKTLSWATGKTVEDRWSSEYSQLYSETYDKKFPAAIKRAAGVKPERKLIPKSGPTASVTEWMVVDKNDPEDSRTLREVAEYVEEDRITDFENPDPQMAGEVAFAFSTGADYTAMSPQEYNQRANFTEVWEIDITPDLRAQVLNEGLPMFMAAEGRTGRTVEQVKADIADLNLGDVKVITSDQMPQKVKDLMPSQGVFAIAGYYDRATGEMALIADNIRNKKHAQATVLHEAVGHRGIENLLGDQFPDFLRQVMSARGRDEVIDAAWDHVERNYPTAGRGTKAAEVIARIAESDPKHTFVQRMVQWMRQALRKLGFNVAFTNGDIIEALRRAKQVVQNESQGEGVSLSSETVNDDAAPESGDILFSSASNNPPFEAPEERPRDRFIRGIQDKFEVLKRLQRNISDSGGVVDDSTDAYVAETLFHGKAENDLRIMKETYVKALANLLAKTGISQQQLDQYLYAMHAPERNAYIASINEKFPDGGSGMTDTKAGTILARVKKSGQQKEYEAAAAIVYKMIEEQRRMVEQGGLEDDGTVAMWRNQYKHYVPLKGFAEDSREFDTGPRAGRGFDIRGKETKSALGRGSEAASPSSQAIVDLTEKVVRRRKNEVGNTLLRLVEQNPNSDYWEVFTDENPDTQPTRVERGGEVIVEDRAVSMRNNQNYFMTKRKGKAYFIKIKDKRLLTAMQNLGVNEMGPVIRSLATVNRWMSALNTSYSPEFMISNFFRDIQTAMLNLQAEQSMGPQGKAYAKKIAAKAGKSALPLGPAQRAIYASLRGMTLKGEGAKWQKAYEEFREAGAQTGYFDMKDVAGQQKDIESLMSMAQGGFTGTSKKWGLAVRDWVEDINRTVENTIRLTAYYHAREAGISKTKAASLAKDMTVNFNRRGEWGSTMNALYMFANASVQGTANFLRTMATPKPGDGPVVTRLNAAQKIAAGLMTMSASLAWLNYSMGGEDDDGRKWYDKVPDWVRERNLVIMKSVMGGPQDGSYWSIPLPYGYNVFNVLGDGAASAALGDEGTLYHAGRVTLAALGSFSPIGFTMSDKAPVTGTLAKIVTPSQFKPLVELPLNENFMNAQIRRENLPFGTPMPNSSLGRNSTPEMYRIIAQSLNRVTGGSEMRDGIVDINPDVMSYFIDYYGGSAAGFVEKGLDYINRVSQDVEVAPHKVPFFGRLDGKVQPYADVDRYYKRREEIGQVMNEITKHPDPEVRRESRKEHSGLIGMAGMLKGTEKQMKMIRQMRTRVYEDETLSLKQRQEKLDEIDQRQKEVIDRFNRRYDERVGD
jgi:hypothetical protein